MRLWAVARLPARKHTPMAKHQLFICIDNTGYEASLERRKIYERYRTHNVGLIWLLQNDPEVPESMREDSRAP